MIRHFILSLFLLLAACGASEMELPNAKEAGEAPNVEGQVEEKQPAPKRTVDTQAKKAARKLDFEHPDSIDYQPYLRKYFARFYGKDPWDTLLLERFSPIGWSDDGKFAWFSEPPDVACGCYTGRFKVQSLVNDKIVWQHNHNSDGLAELRTAADYRKAGAAFWENSKSMLRSKFSELQITAAAEGAFSEFPLEFEGDELTVELSADRKKEGRMKGSVGRIQLKAVSKEKGSKIILNESGSEDPYAWLLDVALLGYIKSPLESRAVVLLLEVHRGFEGPPNVVAVRPVGFGLTKGFKK